ncbi:hypothetical protein QOZ80_2AG0099440 [Eleusine coracana subsp. coracana]|nr:hypothetical protein QOZ80_2AG0099440 [Eleusine coracana subsp. coracana]
MASNAPNIVFRRLFKTLTVSPALASGLTGQHHQLQQHAHVSGTAKGKAKLKSDFRLLSQCPNSPASLVPQGASSGTGGDDGGRVLMGPPGLDCISLGLVDEEAIPKYELTVEDGWRLAKEYSRMLMRQHRARQTAESTLLKLKKEAIAALPEKLQAAALVPDMTPFPTNRYMATLTPPIEGYLEKVRDAAKKYSVKEKLS